VSAALPGDRAPTGTAILLPLAAAAIAMASFQLGASIAKGLFPAVGPVGAATLRLVFGATMLLAIARPWRRWPSGARVAPLVGLGLAAAGGILFFYLAISRLQQGVAIALQFLGPLGVAILTARRPAHWLWAALAALGVWSLVGEGVGARPIDLLGVLWALAAATSWAAYILTGRAAGQAFGGAAAALASSIAALVIAPIGLWQAGAALFDARLLPLALTIAFLATALPFSLELYALPRLPARTFAAFTSLEPAFGVASGAVLLGEHLSLSQVGGVAAVIVAAAGAAWSSHRAGSVPLPITEAPPT
jgi:inner membrane transporter RhtA